MSHLKASSFRVTQQPQLLGKGPLSSANPWAWLHALSVEEWEQLIEINMEENGDDGDNFLVVKPGSEEVQDCPRDIALRAYQDVLAGKTTAPAGQGPIAHVGSIKLPTGGSRMRASVSDSFL